VRLEITVSFSLRCSALLVVLLAGKPVVAQEPVIKTTTRLVQLSVIAKSHDEPAAGLTQDDFKVFVDGHQQKISFFSAVSANPNQPSAPATPMAPNTFSNIVASKEQAATAVTVLLLDLVNTKLTDRIYAQQQMIKYLQSIPPTERIAVYSFNGSLRVLHDYTSTMEVFQQRLAASNGQLVSVINTEQAGAIDSSELSASSEFMNAGSGNAQERAFYMRNRVVGTLNVLKFIASHLAQVPGRKNLIWLSSAFPLRIGAPMGQFTEEFSEEFDATVRALSDANVAVYPVDARGLTTLAGFDASVSSAASGGTGKNWRPPAASSNAHENATHATMQELAQATGGHAYYNTNDLTHAIHQAVEDSALTYTIGFYPDDEKQNRDFHKLKVEVDRPHITLHYRNGYLDLADIPRDERTRSVQLHDALWSPLDATEIGMSVHLSRAATSGLDAAVSLDPKGIQLETKADRHSGRIDLLLAQLDRNGSVLGTPTMQTVQLNLLDATYQKILTNGIGVREPVTVLPSAYRLRVIVRDYGSGMIGSVTVPLSGTL